MTEPTVEEVREALDNIERNFTGQDKAGVPRAAAALDVMVLMKVTRLWLDAAEPDMEAAAKVDDEWIGTNDPRGRILKARAIIAAAFGDNTLIRRTK